MSDTLNSSGKRDYWTRDEIDHLIELLDEANKIVDKHAIIDLYNLYFVTSESRLMESLHEALRWANVIKSVSKNIKES